MMQVQRIVIREFEPFSVEFALLIEVQQAIEETVRRLRPSTGLLSKKDGELVVGNLVGSVRLRSGTILEVLPKVQVEADWVNAVIDLLSAESRIDLHSSRDAGFSPDRSNLTDALAIEYANRLQAALEREGPLQVLQSRFLESRRPSGKLEVTRWVRDATLKPHIFPVTVNELTPNNDFSAAMAFTASLLALSTSHARVASRLRRLAALLIPGQATPTHVPPAIQFRSLPQQWRGYESAWSIVLAVLRNQSLLNSTGRLSGLEVAVEPWPLLETLLGRTLSVVAQRMTDDRSLYVSTPKRFYDVLKLDRAGSGILAGDSTSYDKRVKPDGVLLCNGNAIATFEAKYTQFVGSPNEDHVYQALTAAAVLRAPVSILVYPGRFESVQYNVQGFDGRPAKLVALGLDMYAYRRGQGDVCSADKVLSILPRVGFPVPVRDSKQDWPRSAPQAPTPVGPPVPEHRDYSL